MSIAARGIDPDLAWESAGLCLDDADACRFATSLTRGGLDCEMVDSADGDKGTLGVRERLMNAVDSSVEVLDALEGPPVPHI